MKHFTRRLLTLTMALSMTGSAAALAAEATPGGPPPPPRPAPPHARPPGGPWPPRMPASPSSWMGRPSPSPTLLPRSGISGPSCPSGPSLRPWVPR